MANKKIFGAVETPAVTAADAKNAAGGKAYSFTAEEALAQLASSGTFNKTYYGSEEDQVKAVRKAADEVSPRFLAQTALYARQKGGMKDMPAALLAMLTRADTTLADLIFDRVVDNGKQLRNYVQMVASGAFGRSGFSGSTPKRLVARWINRATPEALLRASVGNDPSLSQVIRLAHPKPADKSRMNLYAYLRGFGEVEGDEPVLSSVTVKGTDGVERVRKIPRWRLADLPPVFQQLELFKRGETTEVPDVDFRFLAGLALLKEQWARIAERGRFVQTFKNLNTYLRHQVYEVPGARDAVVRTLRDRDQVRKARVFPYQLLAAYLNVDAAQPIEVKEALQDALEASTDNVASYGCPVAVVVDVSGSMKGASITGQRKGSTSVVRCVDVAGLVGAVVLRRNPGSLVLPVDTEVHDASAINPRDSIVTIATRLAGFGGGGTALSAALAHLNAVGWRGGLVLVVSDNESWADPTGKGAYAYRGTESLREFRRIQARNPGCRLACLDLAPNTTTQVPSSADVLNVGGFSDAVFETIGRFARGEKTPDDPEAESTAASEWVREIKSIDLATYGLETRAQPSVEPEEGTVDG